MPTHLPTPPIPRLPGDGDDLDLGPLVAAADYDWADQRTSRALDLPDDPPETPPHRLAKLVCNRESDSYDWNGFESIIHRSWSRNHDAPYIDDIRRAGLLPLTDPEQCSFPVIPIRGDKFHAAYFELGNVGWLYSPGSAKHSNKEGNNDFTGTLSYLIEQHRPVILDAVGFNRLVRSLEHGPRLGAAVSRYVERVEAGDYVLDFKEHPEFAQLMWAMLSMLASANRDEIQRENVHGLLVKYTRGRWILPATRTPYGYMYDEATCMIRPNPQMRPQVKEMMRGLTSGMPASLQIELLIEIGALPARPSNAHAAIRAKLRWAALYVNGTWVQRFANPFPDIDERLGVPVHRAAPDDLGYFQLVYRPGLPPGGWAEPPLLSAFLNTARANQIARVGGKRSTHPFTGYEWNAPLGPRGADRQWRLGDSHRHYELRVRPRR